MPNPGHGMHSTPTHNSWRGMIQRCRNSKHKSYAHYGGRGINVCDRWSLFSHFLEDMGVRPKGTTIDRKDSEGDYCKDNCRWATWYEQAQNRRGRRMITANGLTLSLVEWSETTGIDDQTIAKRIKSGWSADDAVNRPVDKSKRSR